MQAASDYLQNPQSGLAEIVVMADLNRRQTSVKMRLHTWLSSTEGALLSRLSSAHWATY